MLCEAGLRVTQFETTGCFTLWPDECLPKVWQGGFGPKVEDLGQGAWLGSVKYTRSTSTATSSSGAVADWSCTIQIPQEHAEKLLSGWKKLWYQQRRTQVSQSDVAAKAIQTAAASTAKNYVEAERLSLFLTRSIPSYPEGEEQGIEQ